MKKSGAGAATIDRNPSRLRMNYTILSNVSVKKDLEFWLKEVLAALKATSGTVHVHEDGGLRLVAAINIPLSVQQIVQWVPNGKGMAGLALQRREPVQTCNLQEDGSGDVKPGAKAVDAQAAVAIPVQNPGDGEVRGVVGVAFQEEREFTAADLKEMTRVVSTMPQVV